MSIPLNMIDQPTGDYSAEVNGTRADVRLENGNSNAFLQTTDMSIAKSDIQVDSVNIEVGVGPFL